MSLPTRTSSNINASADINNLSATPIVVSANQNYTIEDLSTTLLDVLLVTTGATDRTVTLPTASANNNRELTIIKEDSGAGVVIIDGEGAETINGVANFTLPIQYSAVRLKCDGTEWFVLNSKDANVYRITSGMSSAQIVAVLDNAQSVKNSNVTIQFVNGTYTLFQNYTLTGMKNIRILGNSADTGSGSGKDVVLTVGDYTISFVDCQNVLFRYIQTDHEGSSGNFFSLTNSRVNALDCYFENDSQAQSFALVNKGAHFFLQDSTINNYYGVADLFGGVFEYGTGNSVVSLVGDPYFNVSSGVVIDPAGTLVEADHVAGYGYGSLGGTTAAGVMRSGRYKGLNDSNSEWSISMVPGDASASILADYEEGNWTPTLLTTGVNFTSVTYDAITLGRYIKIGRMCFVDGTIRTDAITVGAASGNLLIGGLPFSATTNIFSACAISQTAAWTLNPDSAEIIPSSSTIQLYKKTVLNGDSAVMPYTDAATGTDDNFIRFSCAYRTT